MNLKFRLHCLERDLTNLSILKHLKSQGYMASGQNSGTQWLKYMLSCALANKYDLPVPAGSANSESNEFIGHPKHKPIYDHVPRVASTHAIPHLFYDSGLFRHFFEVPKTAVLVRDMRATLVSNYEKFKLRYNIPFSEYLKGDISENNYVIDIWWYVHFMNRWGRVKERFPDNVLVIKYEDIQHDAKAVMRKVFDHFAIEISDEDLEFAAAESSREKMAKKAGRRTVPGEGQIIRQDTRHFLEWYSQDDLEFVRKTCRENMNYDFGYDLK